jgi:hypothetical protein
LNSVSERSPGVDERVAVLFRDMRWALGLTKPELARKLKSTQSVIDAMELGRIGALPAWPETVRIVCELGRLNRVDVRPILARIRDQMGPAGLGRVPARSAAAPSTARSSEVKSASARAGAPPPPPPPLGAGTGGKPQPRARSRVRADRAARVLSALSAPVIMAAGLLWIAQAQSSTVMAAVTALPEPLAKLVRPVADYLVVRLAPRRDGLRWVEVGDPRARKADKLRQAAR